MCDPASSSPRINAFISLNSAYISIRWISWRQTRHEQKTAPLDSSIRWLRSYQCVSAYIYIYIYIYLRLRQLIITVTHAERQFMHAYAPAQPYTYHIHTYTCIHIRTYVYIAIYRTVCITARCRAGTRSCSWRAVPPHDVVPLDRWSR